MRRYNITVNGREFDLDVQELGADRFTVTIGGEQLEVELRTDEDVSEGQITPAIIARTTAPQITDPESASSTSTPSPVPVLRHPSSAGSGSAALKAPMPGVIAEISATVGARVARGDTLLLLEAMKMKNAIRSPREGVIAEILVQPGQNVGHGDVLIRFEEKA